MPAYLQALVRSGQISQEVIDLASILGYEPAAKLSEADRKFCELPSGASMDYDAPFVSNWTDIANRYDIAPELLVFMGDWFMMTLAAPSSDAYFSAIQMMIPRFQRAYRDFRAGERAHVNGYDGGYIQELIYGCEGAARALLWFVYNSCEYFDGISFLDEPQLHSSAKMAVHWALNSISLISRKPFCEYLQARLLEHILPEMCHISIRRRNPYRRNSDEGMRRLEREYHATIDPAVLDQIRVMQRRTKQSTSAGPQAYKYGGHGVDHELRHQRNTPLVFWSPVGWHSYVLVDHYSNPKIWGDFWEHPIYGDVDLISINGIGEIRWQVDPTRKQKNLNVDDRSAVIYFGFFGETACGDCKGAGRILPTRFAMPYEAVTCTTCNGTGVIPD